MNETSVTAAGRLATSVALRRFESGAVKASFRIACDRGWRDRRTGDWVEGETLFMTVICWRSLAEHVAESLHMGDPVVVEGRLGTRTFESEGRRGTVVEIEATAIGPNLAHCTTVVTRSSARTGVRTEAAVAAIAAATVELDAGGDADGRGQWRAGPLVPPDELEGGRPEERSLVGAGAGGEGGGGR